MNKKIVGVSFVVLILLCMALMLATLYKKSMPRVMHCSPWRNVIGYEALCSELNMVMNCSLDPCSGETQSKNFHQLASDNGEVFRISSIQKLEPAQQNDVMVQAMKLAYHDLPKGYFISNISFTPSEKKEESFSSVDLKVTYKICGLVPIQ